MFDSLIYYSPPFPLTQGTPHRTNTPQRSQAPDVLHIRNPLEAALLFGSPQSRGLGYPRPTLSRVRLPGAAPRHWRGRTPGILLCPGDRGSSLTPSCPPAGESLRLVWGWEWARRAFS